MLNAPPTGNPKLDTSVLYPLMSVNVDGTALNHRCKTRLITMPKQCAQHSI